MYDPGKELLDRHTPRNETEIERRCTLQLGILMYLPYSSDL
jgi:hypothetical protein